MTRLDRGGLWRSDGGGKPLSRCVWRGERGGGGASWPCLVESWAGRQDRVVWIGGESKVVEEMSRGDGVAQMRNDLTGGRARGALVKEGRRGRDQTWSRGDIRAAMIGGGYSQLCISSAGSFIPPFPRGGVSEQPQPNSPRSSPFFSRAWRGEWCERRGHGWCSTR